MSSVLLIVPLSEEFDEVKKVLPIEKYECRDEEFLYALKTDSEVMLTGVVLGVPGPTPAAQRTERLIAMCAPSLIVVTGIAGSLSDDVRLGDVVIAEEINHYLANSKATSPATEVSQAGAFQYVLSGRSTRTSYPLLQALRNFRHAGPDLYAQWQQDCQTRLDALASTRPVRSTLGHIACGDSVGDSNDFVSFLKLFSDRKYDALEMESSGVAEAATARREPIPVLILRGISDLSQQKGALESATRGAWRAVAAANAASLLSHLLRWREFLDTFCGPEEPGLHDDHIRNVMAFLKGTK